MTLDTKVAIGAPTDVMELFAFCQRLVNTPPGFGVREGDSYIGNNPVGIGADSLMDVTYTKDGEPMVHECDKWCANELGGEYNHTQADVDYHDKEVATDPRMNGWAYIIVSFDTPYGYRGDDGESCSDQHARLVTALGTWLDAKALPWKWQNEYTSEWFDRWDRLDTFGDAHRTTGADAWYHNMVVPAIMKMGMPMNDTLSRQFQDQINAICQQAEAVREGRVTNRRAALLLLRSNVETLLAWDEVTTEED